MPGLTHKIQITASTVGQSRPISGYIVEAGTSMANVDQNIPANSADLPVALAFPVATMKTFVAWADKGCTLVVTTTAGPVTFNLIPGPPWLWYASDGEPPPFAGDVTGATVTTTVATQLRITALVA